jgi:hypothetical protein
VVARRLLVDVGGGALVKSVLTVTTHVPFTPDHVSPFTLFIPGLVDADHDRLTAFLYRQAESHSPLVLEHRHSDYVSECLQALGSEGTATLEFPGYLAHHPVTLRLTFTAEGDVVRLTFRGLIDRRP